LPRNIVNPTVVPHGRPTVQPGTVPMLLTGRVVVVVGGLVVIVVDGTLVVATEVAVVTVVVAAKATRLSSGSRLATNKAVPVRAPSSPISTTAERICGLRSGRRCLLTKGPHKSAHR
jgi:hypothetical protein